MGFHESVTCLLHGQIFFVNCGIKVDEIAREKSWSLEIGYAYVVVG